MEAARPAASADPGAPGSASPADAIDPTHLDPAPGPASAPTGGLLALGFGLALALALLAAWALRRADSVALLLALLCALLALAAGMLLRRHGQRLDRRRTDAAALAARAQAAQQAAVSAGQARGRLLAGVSHEIRVPFQALMGRLSLLLESGLAPHQLDHLRAATESAEEVLASLNDLLDLSQLESGRIALAEAPVDLRALLHEVEARMRPQALAKALTLHVDVDPALPDRVLADAQRVKQVVFNLLGHALKSADQGAVTLALRVATRDDAPWLEFEVGDSEGAAPLRAGRPARSGLGLEISRTLACLMAGAVESGDGARRVVFRLPLRAAPAAGGDTPAACAAAARRLHVLVAEDQPVNRQYMAALLDSLHHDVHFCTDGQEAVDALRQPPLGRRFDIVLMDLHMPVLDGIGATIAIRALHDPGLSTVPIVALTADALALTRERCLVAGMNDFLTKPVSPQKLATSLRRLFGDDPPPEPQGSSLKPEPAAPRAASAVLLDALALSTTLQAMPRERLADMVHAFLDQGPQTVQRLRAAMRDAQPLALRLNAHAARGVALNLGLPALAATAEALYEGSAHLPAHEIARLVKRFEDLLRQTRQAALEAGLVRSPTTAGAEDDATTR